MADIETRLVAANGIQINVAPAGAGPAILLLHGFPHGDGGGARRPAERLRGAVVVRLPQRSRAGRPVGDALHRQLRPITDNLTGRLIADCGHIVPLDRPEALLPHL